MKAHGARDAARTPTHERAREIVLAHGWNPVAYQVLNPGIEHWFDPAGDAVVGYASFRGTRVVVGAPVCAPGRLAEVAERFEQETESRAGRALFFGAGARLERILGGRDDHRLVPLGAQPSWDPREWEAIVQRKASLRAQVRRAHNKRVVVRRAGAGECAAVPLQRAMQEVLEFWLAGRGLPPLRFMTHADLLGDLGDRRVYVAERSGTVVAYLVASPIPARDGWLVEQWPRIPSAPNGTTQALVDAVMRDVARDGARYVSLGLSPLSRLGDPAGHEPPAWLKPLFGWLRAHGRRFYDFAGLESFKAALQPSAWEPVFAIAHGPRFTPSMLRAIAGVFSGGPPEWFVARALAHAAWREVRGQSSAPSRRSSSRFRSTPHR